MFKRESRLCPLAPGSKNPWNLTQSEIPRAQSKGIDGVLLFPTLHQWVCLFYCFTLTGGGDEGCGEAVTLSMSLAHAEFVFGKLQWLLPGIRSQLLSCCDLKCRLGWFGYTRGVHQRWWRNWDRAPLDGDCRQGPGDMQAFPSLPGMFLYNKMIQRDLLGSGDKGCTSPGSLHPESRGRKNQSDHEMGMVRDGLGRCLKSPCLLTNLGLGSIYVVEEYFFGLFWLGTIWHPSALLPWIIKKRWHAGCGFAASLKWDNGWCETHFVPSCAAGGEQPMVLHLRAAGKASTELKITKSPILVNVEE